MKNFGIIKEAYVNLMLEGMKTNDKNKKNLYHKFLSKIKSNPILKQQAKLYSLLENISAEEDGKKEFIINEAVKSIDDNDRKKMFVENINLAKDLFENNVDFSELKYEKQKLHEAISNVLFLKRNVQNIKVLAESKHYLETNTIKPTEKIIKPSVVSPKAIMEVAIDKIYKSYPELSGDDYKLVGSVLLGDVKEKEKNFNGLVSECRDKLSGTKDIDNELLESALNKLDSMAFNNDTFIDDILKLNELKNSF